MSSRTQTVWRRLAVRVREQLEARVAELGAMTPEEAGQFVAACREAYWLAVNATSFDTQVEEDNRPHFLRGGG